MEEWGTETDADKRRPAFDGSLGFCVGGDNARFGDEKTFVNPTCKLCFFWYENGEEWAKCEGKRLRGLVLIDRNKGVLRLSMTSQEEAEMFMKLAGSSRTVVPSCWHERKE